MTDDSNMSDIPVRVGTLERALENLSNTVSESIKALSSQVAAQNREHQNDTKEILDRISQVSHAATRVEKTDWRTLLAAASVLGALVTFILLPIKSDIEEHRATLQHIERRTSVNGWSLTQEERKQDLTEYESQKELAYMRESMDLKFEIRDTKHQNLSDFVDNLIENIPEDFETYKSKWENYQRKSNK